MEMRMIGPAFERASRAEEEDKDRGDGDSGRHRH